MKTETKRDIVTDMAMLYVDRSELIRNRVSGAIIVINRCISQDRF